jgi:hypothetical protein
MSPRQEAILDQLNGSLGLHVFHAARATSFYLGFLWFTLFSTLLGVAFGVWFLGVVGFDWGMAANLVLWVAALAVALGGFLALHRVLPWTGGMKEITRSNSRMAREIRALAQEIIPGDQLRILFDYRSASIVPSVDHEEGDHYRLYVPGAMVCLWSADPAMGRAMVAHELGHIRQDDFVIWKNARRVARYVHILVAMNVWCGVASFLSAFLLLVFWPGVAIARLLFMVAIQGLRLWLIVRMGRDARESLEEYRTESEADADLVAAAFTDGPAMMHVLHRLLSSAGPSKEDSTLPARYQRIVDLVNRWGDADSGTQAVMSRRARMGLEETWWEWSARPLAGRLGPEPLTAHA